MHVTLSGHHLDLTDALRAYVQEKFTRIERHFDDAATNAQVILSIDNQEHKAEATLRVAGHDVHANATDHDMYVAIDAMIDKIDRQIIKHREKLNQKHRGEKVRHYEA